MAEPENELDKNFRKHFSESTIDLKEKYFKKIDNSVAAASFLRSTIVELKDKVWDMSKEEIYHLLSFAAFDTNDTNKINAEYLRDQRVGFRLAIANFIQDLDILKKYKPKFEENPKPFVENILESSFQGIVEVDVTPIGFVMYLDNIDFKSIPLKRDEAQAFTIMNSHKYKNVPPELIGRIIVMNKNDRYTDDGKITFDHEINHMEFSSFYSSIDSQTIRTFSIDEINVIAKSRKISFDEATVRLLSKNISDLQEHVAQSEIIAYLIFTDPNREIPKRDLNRYYDGVLDNFRKLLDEGEMSQEKYDMYLKKYILYKRNVAEYISIAKNLAVQLNQNGVVYGMDETGVSSLLSMMPPHKYRTLQKYIEWKKVQGYR